MKGLKKILTGILAGAMALSLTLSAGTGIAAKAAADGSITVSNTTNGMEYKLYKVFDATYSGTNVAYTYTKKGDKDDFYDALIDSKSPFTLEGSGPYNVTLKATATEDEILDFIRANGPQAKTEKDENGNVKTDADGNPIYEKDKNGNQLFTDGKYGSAIATATGNGSSIKFENLDYGYYFITSTLGTVVTIDNALKDASVIDKNQESNVDKQNSVDGGTTWYYEGNGKVEDPAPTQMIGAKVNYKLTGKLTQYRGTKFIKYYTFTDTMDEGLTPPTANDIEIKIDNADPKMACTVDVKGQVITIKVPIVSDEEHATSENPGFLYGSEASYVITYSATINEKALDGAVDNKVILKDSNNEDYTPDETTVKNYKIDLTKEDNAGTRLAGAEFKLFQTKTGDDEIKVVLVTTGNEGENYGTAKYDGANVYRVATADEIANNKNDVMVTGKTGQIQIKGLKNGDYYVEETKAPDGFNKLTERQKVNTTIQNAPEGTKSINDADGTVTVVNNSGLKLPSTGGIGTTIFYIIGGLLIVAAVVFFVVRRKADAE